MNAQSESKNLYAISFDWRDSRLERHIRRCLDSDFTNPKHTRDNRGSRSDAV
jgi:hypothetical protein